MLDELLSERVVSSRGRRNPRTIKRVARRYPPLSAWEPLPKRIPAYAACVVLK